MVSQIRKILQYKYFYLMMLPGLIYLIINNYIPMAGLVMAFKKVNFSVGIWKSEWVGLNNFRYLFATRDAWVITRNTVLYNIAFIIIGLVLSIAVAIALSEMARIKLRSFFQSVILIPYILSYVVVSYLVFAFLGSTGLINKGILPLLGMDPINWYLTPKYWPFILIFVNTWKTVGYSSVIFFSTILGFDPQVYEAADIDGAGSWKKISLITIPLLKPTIITLTMLNIGRIFYSDFGLFYQVPQNSGAIYNTTNVIDTYVYRGLLELGDVSMSSAAGFYQAIVGFVIVLAANWIVRKLNYENALF